MISVILTCYNREKYLAQTIESVLNQTYTNFELIIWDDGSTDNSVAIAESYANSDSRIKLIVANHQGFTRAASSAIALSTGGYFGFLDSDDYLAPTCLEETKRVLDQDCKSGVAYTFYNQIDSRGNDLGLGHRCKFDYSTKNLLRSFITFHFRLIRREIYESIGGLNTSYEYASDYDLCLRLSENTDFLQIKKTLYFYRNHAHNMSNTSKGLQISFAWQAISESLQRRKLDESFYFELIKKPSAI